MGKRIKEDAGLRMEAMEALIEGGAVTHKFDEFEARAIFLPRKIHISRKMSETIGRGLYDLSKKMKIEKHFIGVPKSQSYSDLIEDIIDKIEIAHNEDKRGIVRRVFLNDARFDRSFSPEQGNKFFKKRSKIVLVDISLKSLKKSIDVCIENEVTISSVFIVLRNREDFRLITEKCKENRSLANTEFHLFLPLEDVFANYFFKKMM